MSEHPGTAPPPGDGAPQVRFALAMNGGVSLAVWIGGVCDEMLRLCRAVDDGAEALLDSTEIDDAWSVYQKVCWAAGSRARVDVMSGASAGGMNAVFLALGLVYGRQNLVELRDLWLDAGSFESLLRDPLDSEAPSLMRGDEYFLVALQDALRTLASGAPRSAASAPVDVTLTATSMEGREERYPQKYGEPILEKDHRVTLRFRHADEDSDLVPAAALEGAEAARERERVIHRLARACRSTASFPGAFEPSRGTVDAGNVVDGPLDAFDPRQTNLREPSWLIDGGTLVNLPVEEALSAVFEMPATGAVRRVFAMIVPDPSTAPQHGRVNPTEAPSLQSVVTSALSTIPRNQMVGSFLRELEERNDRLEVLRAARVQLLTLDWAVLAATATPLFDAYVRSRRMTSDQSLEDHLDVALADRVPAAQRAAAREVWLAEVLRRRPPWIPTDLADHRRVPLQRWGRTTVRRSAARVLHLIELVEATPRAASSQEIARWRGITTGAITAMKAPTSSVDRATNHFASVRSFVPADGDLAAHVAKEADELWTRWSTSRTAVAHHLAQLSTVVAELRSAVAASEATEPFPGPQLRSLRTLPEDGGLSLLLALEVIENSFGGFANQIEQPVETLRIDSLEQSPLDQQVRKQAAGKVAGVQLAHFGSFLKAAWRANDWMWGRLDGSADLITVMLQKASGERVTLLQQHLGVPATETVDAATIAAVVRRRHTDIVLEEAGSVVAGIVRDRDAGGHTSQHDRALERAWEAELAHPSATPDEREHRARELLSLNRIGAETLADQAGSDLLTRTAITALATGTTVLQRSKLTPLTGVVPAVRFVALLIWGLGKGSFGGAYARVLGALIFGIGATIVVVELMPGVTAGALLPIGVSLLAAGTILAFLRAPFVALPTIFLIAFPFFLRWLPADPWSWWPADWPFPTLRDRAEWLAPLAVIVGVIVIGTIRRPVWFRGITVDHAMFDSWLAETARGIEPAPVAGAAPRRLATVLRVVRHPADAPDRPGWRRHLALWTMLVLVPAIKTVQLILGTSFWVDLVRQVALVIVLGIVAWWVLRQAPAGETPKTGDASVPTEAPKTGDGSVPTETGVQRRRRFLHAIGIVWPGVQLDQALTAPTGLAASITWQRLRRVCAVLAVVAGVSSTFPGVPGAGRWVGVGVTTMATAVLLVAEWQVRRRMTPVERTTLGPVSLPWLVTPLALACLTTSIALGAGVDGADVDVMAMLHLVVITVIGEELIFRGLLLAMASRVLRADAASFVTAASFGLWHVGDAWNGSVGDVAGARATQIVGTVLLTLAGGLVFTFMRRRSRSLLGPVLAHLATNLPGTMIHRGELTGLLGAVRESVGP